MINSLIKLGLTENEAKIYLELTKSGALQAGLISKNTQINRRTTYDTLQKLIKEGFVSSSKVNTINMFQAAPPKLFLDKIKKQKDEANKVVQDLQTISKEPPLKPKIETYTGKKGIKGVLNDILRQKDYVVFGSNEKFPEVMMHEFLLFQKQKKEKRIKSKTLMSSEMKGKDILKKAHTKYRFIDNEFSPNTSTFIYSNKISIIIWNDVPIATLIESKEVSSTYKSYFNALWSSAKE